MTENKNPERIIELKNPNPETRRDALRDCFRKLLLRIKPQIDPDHDKSQQITYGFYPECDYGCELTEELPDSIFSSANSPHHVVLIGQSYIEPRFFWHYFGFMKVRKEKFLKFFTFKDKEVLFWVRWPADYTATGRSQKVYAIYFEPFLREILLKEMQELVGFVGAKDLILIDACSVAKEKRMTTFTNYC